MKTALPNTHSLSSFSLLINCIVYRALTRAPTPNLINTLRINRILYGILYVKCFVCAQIEIDRETKHTHGKAPRVYYYIFFCYCCCCSRIPLSRSGHRSSRFVRSSLFVRLTRTSERNEQIHNWPTYTCT